MENSNNNINDQIKIEFKLNDVKNEPKPFGFHIPTINIPISVVLIKRVWKRRRQTFKNVLKKSYKKKTKDKSGIKSKEVNVENTEYVKKGETLDPKEFTGDRKWCWDEFERHIGIPKRKDMAPSIAVASIRLKSLGRFIPEAKNLRRPKRNDSIFLASDKPRRNCLCPDRECLCFGTSIIDKRVKIPKNWRLCPCSTLKGYLSISPRKNANANNFIKKMIAATSASEKEKEAMYKGVIFGKKLCLSKCNNSHIVGEKLPTPKEIKFKIDKEKVLDERVCNVVFCTVSTQTSNAPNGDLIMGTFSHLLYSNNQKTFLSDIRGNKLQISHYTYVCPKPLDLRVCTKNVEKLLNFKKMKVRLSNLISSIYVIKDPGIPLRSSATQVPRKKNEIIKIGAPNRCGDENYGNIKEVPWNFKMQEAIFDEMRRLEVEKEHKDDVCPCCEYLADSVDMKAYLENMRNTLTIPGGEKDQLGDSITIVKKIIGEIVANAIDDFYEEENNKKNKVPPSLINAGKASEINPEQNKFVDKEKVELSKDLPSNNEMNPRSSIKNSKSLEPQIIKKENNTSKDKIVLQVNTSYKKASKTLSSLFKWLFDPSTLLSQIIRTSSVMCVSKDKLSTDILSTDILSTDILSTDILSTDILSTDKLPTDTNINRDAKSSEKEVFSIRYTSSVINDNKSTSFEYDKELKKP